MKRLVQFGNEGRGAEEIRWQSRPSKDSDYTKSKPISRGRSTHPLSTKAEVFMTDTAIIIGAGLPDGIGGATALRFATEGLHVIVSGRTQAKLDQTVSQIRTTGGSAEAIVADVTSAGDLAALFDRAKELSQRVSSVVYNAGNNHMTPFADLTAQDFEANWRVSVTAGETQLRPLCFGQRGSQKSRSSTRQGIWPSRGSCCPHHHRWRGEWRPRSNHFRRLSWEIE